jgi:thiamine-phosphate pyrophosphorylase
MSIIKDWKVYLVTDRLHARGRSTLEIVKAAVEGGVSVVQLREKNLGTRDFLNEGLLIRDFLKSKSVPLIINDRVDIALALDADGVHVGQEDMPVDMVRKLLGPEKIIGLSIQDLSQIDEIATENADYIAVSPIFPTATKNTDSHWGIEG